MDSIPMLPHCAFALSAMLWTCIMILLDNKQQQVTIAGMQRIVVLKELKEAKYICVASKISKAIRIATYRELHGL